MENDSTLHHDITVAGLVLSKGMESSQSSSRTYLPILSTHVYSHVGSFILLVDVIDFTVSRVIGDGDKGGLITDGTLQ